MAMSDVIKKIPRISEDITTRILGDEAVIMNLKTVKTYSLNETAARIWSFINGSRTIHDIVQKMFEEYDVSDTVCTLVKCPCGKAEPEADAVRCRRYSHIST